jgi:hypothetical protein
VLDLSGNQLSGKVGYAGPMFDNCQRHWASTQRGFVSAVSTISTPQSACGAAHGLHWQCTPGDSAACLAPTCLFLAVGNSSAALQQLCTDTPSLQALNLSLNPMLEGEVAAWGDHAC